VLQRVKEERNILPAHTHTVQQRKSNWFGHILRRSCLPFRKRKKGREDEEEDVSIYWMTLRRRED